MILFYLQEPKKMYLIAKEAIAELLVKALNSEDNGLPLESGIYRVKIIRKKFLTNSDHPWKNFFPLPLHLLYNNDVKENKQNLFYQVKMCKKCINR